ncbi:MAG: M23 family metallopeptidase [Campylobacterales bacterium]|nr:M23 family metallopeptidase [Campylobacterales bacterium]
MKIILLILFFISSLSAYNALFRDSNVSNGKTVFIEFKKEKDVVYEKITMDKESYKVFNNPVDAEKMYALVPVSYYEKPSSKKIEVYYKEKNSYLTKSMLINIEDGKYEKEKIEVTKSKVNPNKEDAKIAEQEYQEAMKIYNSTTAQSYIKSEFIFPIDSIITSDFGKARVYNDSLQGYHGGTDFRAKVGTPIYASNDGVVVLAKERFYSGGTVIIDHGQGIYTCYFHMSKFDVACGQKIEKSALIGFSGESGRVSGPHLHFATRVGGVQVDPLQLISLLNKNLFKGTK